jgi:hypothetical protein
MNTSETYFQVLTLLSRVSQVGVTYEGVTLVHMTNFHMDIGCHVNRIDPTTPFGIQNESHHFESSMSRATSFGVTYFETKSIKYVFLIIYRFSITKNN